MERRKVGVFLQARLGSIRLPRKVLAEVGNTPLLEHAMERLGTISGVHVVVCDLPSLGALTPIVKRNPGWEIFAGSPDDVMLRFIQAADAYGVEVIVRATGDNPLVDGGVARELVEFHLSHNAEATRPMGMTPGTAVEVVNAQTLRELHPIAKRHDREHVMPLVYDLRPTNTLWYWETYPESVTVDTAEDLERVRKVVTHG